MGNVYLQIERTPERAGAPLPTQESIDLTPSDGEAERFLERVEGGVQTGDVQGVPKFDQHMPRLLRGRQGCDALDVHRGQPDSTQHPDETHPRSVADPVLQPAE